MHVPPPFCNVSRFIQVALGHGCAAQHNSDTDNSAPPNPRPGLARDCKLLTAACSSLPPFPKARKGQACRAGGQPGPDCLLPPADGGVARAGNAHPVSPVALQGALHVVDTVLAPRPSVAYPVPALMRHRSTVRQTLWRGTTTLPPSRPPWQKRRAASPRPTPTRRPLSPWTFPLR